MDNKGLIEYKPNLITKIKQFFKNLFCKKDTVLKENSVDIKNHTEERNFAEEIKVKNCCVVTWNSETVLEDGINVIPIWKFCLE